MYPSSASPAAEPTQIPPSICLAAPDNAEAHGFASGNGIEAQRLVTEASKGVAAVAAFGDLLAEALGGAALQTCSEMQHKVCLLCRRCVSSSRRDREISYRWLTWLTNGQRSSGQRSLLQ